MTEDSWRKIQKELDDIRQYEADKEFEQKAGMHRLISTISDLAAQCAADHATAEAQQQELGSVRKALEKLEKCKCSEKQKCCCSSTDPLERVRAIYSADFEKADELQAQNEFLLDSSRVTRSTDQLGASIPDLTRPVAPPYLACKELVIQKCDPPQGGLATVSTAATTTTTGNSQSSVSSQSPAPNPGTPSQAANAC